MSFSNPFRSVFAAVLITCFGPILCGQMAQVPKAVPVPSLQARGPVPDPAVPAAREVEDVQDRLTFHLPNGWNLSTTDGEVSTFHLDARSAPHLSHLRIVASLAFNPYPQSTFEGALFYVSATPHSTASACAFQTAPKTSSELPPVRIDDVNFAQRKEEHGKICTESRDIFYTAIRGESCLRFDLVIHNFCGGEVSGAQDLGSSELQALFGRLQSILDTVHFTTAR